MRSSTMELRGSTALASLALPKLLLPLLLLLGICFISVPVTRAQDEEETTDNLILPADVSYVLEPFEENFPNVVFLDTTGASTAVEITLEETDALFGDFAARAEYTLDGSSASSKFSISSINPDRPHTCFGASELFFWYKTPPLPEEDEEDGDEAGGTENVVAATLQTPLRLSLTLLDDRACTAAAIADTNTNLDCSQRSNLDEILVWEGTLASTVAAAEEWQEVRLPVDDLPAELTLERIRGFVVSLETTSTSATPIEGRLLLDQLACAGDGYLLGSTLYPLMENWAALLADGTVATEYFSESSIPETDSQERIEDGMFAINYTVQQVESWGGFNGYSILAPLHGYWNLSQANAIIFNYTLTNASSIPERAIFRLVLNDGRECDLDLDADAEEDILDCANNYHLHERFYSFHAILDPPADVVATDSDSGPISSGQVILQLRGSLDFPDPFWLTWWSGVKINQELDRAYVKGFSYEVVLDSVLPLGTFVSGGFTVGDLRAANAFFVGDNDDTCRIEPNLYFRKTSPSVERVEFFSNICCELCQGDSACLYAMTDSGDCFLISSLEAEDVELVSSSLQQRRFTTYWMDDPVKRGDFCDKCECSREERAIDCRGKNLTIVPKLFNGTLWMPRSLDLRDNPNLVFLGDQSLDQVAADLEELWLPSTMRHLSPELLKQLGNLKSLRFENDMVLLNNAITDDSQPFGDLCCSRGNQLTLASGNDSVTFCNLESDEPGRDAVYMPFYDILGRSDFSASPSSLFMSEAAESAEKCAEFCSINRDCGYFTYDARLANAEHLCRFFAEISEGLAFVCCKEDHFADVNQTIPGLVSGRPPRTRHTDDNATVVLLGTNLILNNRNGYEATYEVTLGSNPLRGAVWIEPELAVADSDLAVVFTPPRVVLYDNSSLVQITVTISGRKMSETFAVNNLVRSCDPAFTETEADQVFVNVVVPGDDNTATIIIAVVVPFVAVVVFLLVGFYFYHERSRHKNDSIWNVKMDELHFDSPPEVIGRGSFGLVVLAEYRGTKVAIKRAIPPRSLESSSKFATILGSTAGGSDVSPPYNITGSTSMTGSLVAPVVLGSGVVGVSSGMGAPPVPNRQASDTSQMQGGRANDRAVWRRMKSDFSEEMRLLSKLRHRSITTVMGAVIDSNEETLMVMEYMDHGSLYDMLHNETMVLESDMLVTILCDIVQGIRFLHSADPQVIHGDLKASNILVDGNFRAKLSDFGLAVKRHQGATGTPYWMAPELLRTESKNTASSDIYSFGIILYEVFSRREPYDGEIPAEVLKAVADKNVNKRPSIPGTAPAALQLLMAECFETDPEKRPSAVEVDTRLKRLDAESLGDLGGSGRRKRASSIMTLFDIFPRHIAEALRDGKKVEPEHREIVTIFFSDIVGFTTISATLTPQKVADLLERLYTRFDELSLQHDVFKVETIGDSYMAVTNLVKDQPDDHVKRIAAFAMEAIAMANEVLIDEEDPSRGCVNMRVGFHSGPVVANVVGKKNPRYCLFGDTVNTASRMESSSKENRIQCSSAAAEILKKQSPDTPLKHRGFISVKGKGEMETYWVNETGRSRRGRKKLDAFLGDTIDPIREDDTTHSDSVGALEEQIFAGINSTSAEISSAEVLELTEPLLTVAPPEGHPSMVHSIVSPTVAAPEGHPAVGQAMAPPATTMDIPLGDIEHRLDSKVSDGQASSSDGNGASQVNGGETNV